MPNISQEGRDALILDALPAVRQIALKIKKRLPPWIDLEDLISEGNLGLCIAAMRYEDNKGKFRTFAGHRIMGQIKDYLRTNGLGAKASHSPLNHSDSIEACDEPTGDCSRLVELREAFERAYEKLNEWDRAFVRLYYFEGRTQKEISRAMGVSESRICQLRPVLKAA